MSMAKAIEYWDKKLKKKAPGTRENYRHHFKRFLDRYGITAEELYEMQREALAAEDPRESDAVVDMVIGLMRELQDQGKAPGTATGVAKAVKSFLDANKLAFEVSRDDMPVNVHDGQKVILPEQIRTLHDWTGSEFKLRNRALMMFAKDSGLRVSDIAALTVSQYLEAEDLTGQTFQFEANGGVVTVQGDGFKRFRPITTRKKGVIAYVHIGPEAVEAVDAYLKERRTRSGGIYEVLHGQKTERRRYPVFDIDQRLFLGRGGRPLSRNAMVGQFKRFAKFLGKASFKVSAHSFRKFHTTYLELGRVPKNWIKKLQGKATDPYSHPEQTGELTKAYIVAYPKLRIFDAEALIREEEIKQLRARVSQLEAAIMQQTPGEEAPRYSLHTSGNQRPQLHDYSTRVSRIAQLQQAIQSGKDLGKLFDSKTGKLLLRSGVMVRL